MTRFLGYLKNLDGSNLSWSETVVIMVLSTVVCLVVVLMALGLVWSMISFPTVRFIVFFCLGTVVSRAFVNTWRKAHAD